MKASLMDNAPPCSLGTCTAKGWITDEKFTMWFDHFIKTVQPQARETPVLLIFDGHMSHTRNLDVIEKAREHNVVLLCLPSHCTHRLQPLDVSFFKTMNWNYDEEIRNWMREHNGRRVAEEDVAGIFATAYAKSATLKIAISGFQKCGIVPFRKDLFTDEDFLGADVTDQPLPDVSILSKDLDESGMVSEIVELYPAALVPTVVSAVIEPLPVAVIPARPTVVADHVEP